MLLRLLITLWRQLAMLPLPWLHAIGRGLGHLYEWIPNRERQVVQTNLELCYPQLSPMQRQRMRARVMQQLGCSLMEMSYIWFRPVPDVLAKIRGISGEELLQRPPGQGVIVLSPHLGCWEIVGLDLPFKQTVTSLYRPPRLPALEEISRASRERSGAQVVPTDAQGVKRIYQALKEGGVTCILPDQQPPSARASVFAPFFGIPALTMLFVQRLARKTGAKIVFVYAERLARGQGYHIHYLPAPEGMDDEDPQVAATSLNQGVERLVRACPDQYQWSYKRFRDQPDGGASPYKKKS
jgi:KDO2-lipid IV(A) lauroyltransferase